MSADLSSLRFLVVGARLDKELLAEALVERHLDRVVIVVAVRDVGVHPRALACERRGDVEQIERPTV